MATAILKRTLMTDKGTFGQIIYNGEILCDTCERPWRNNKVGDSCIPEGTYECTNRTSKKYKNHWLVNNVPGRSYILIHPGNHINHTRGCILPGNGRTWFGKLFGVVQSRVTMRRMKRILPNSFTLIVTNS